VAPKRTGIGEREATEISTKNDKAAGGSFDCRSKTQGDAPYFLQIERRIRNREIRHDKRLERWVAEKRAVKKKVENGQQLSSHKWRREENR